MLVAFFQCQKDSWQNGDRDDRSDGIDVDVGCQCNYCGEGAVEINVVVENYGQKCHHDDGVMVNYDVSLL